MMVKDGHRKYDDWFPNYQYRAIKFGELVSAVLSIGVLFGA